MGSNPLYEITAIYSIIEISIRKENRTKKKKIE
jgi:hypothetical protein